MQLLKTLLLAGLLSLLFGSGADDPPFIASTLYANSARSLSDDYVCGDADGSGAVELDDALFILNYIFTGAPAPVPVQSGDQNCDGTINLTDCTYIIAYLYAAGEAPCCFSEADFCPRKYTTAFNPETAVQMANLAAEAYHIGPDLPQGQVIRNCWVAIKSIESDPDFDCPVPQVPGQSDTQLFLVRDPWTNDIAVVFRGTESIPDWLTDAQFANAVDWQFEDGTVVPDAVHRGFYCAYASIRAELVATLNGAIAEVDDPASTRVYFTGHSLGGALTTLAALDLSNWLVNTKGFRRDNVIMYSIAAPKPFKTNLLNYFRQRVPNAYGVMERTDPVPYVPAGYERVDQMAVLNSRIDNSGNVTDTRLEFANGLEITACGPAARPCPASYGAAGHDRDDYVTRLEKVRIPGIPSISVDVNNGKMRFNWTGAVQGPCDRIMLCMDCPDEITNLDLLANPWEWAVQGNSQQTQITKTEGFQAAYINSFGEVVAKSAKYKSPAPSSLTIDREPLGGVRVEWSMSQEGEYDYVALYREHPNTAGPNGFAVGKKHLVFPDLVDRWGTTMFNGPIWVAYVTSDALVGGNRRILKVAGPID